MKKLLCKSTKREILSTSRFVYMGSEQPTQHTEPPEAQKAFHDIEQAVKNLEGTKKEMVQKRTEAVNQVVKLLKEKPQYFSPELLDALSNIKDTQLLQTIAAHPTLPEAIQLKLAKQGGPETDKALATNPALTDKAARELAKRNITIDPLIIGKNAPPQRTIRNLLSALNSSPKLLEIYSQKPNVDVQKIVAAHPNTSIAVLNTLAASSDFHILQGLAKNPALPANLIKTVFEKSFPNDQTALLDLIKNKNTPKELIQKMATYKPAPNDEWGDHYIIHIRRAAQERLGTYKEAT